MFGLLNRLGIDTAGFDRWSIHFSGAEHTWSWILIMLVAGAMFSLSFIAARHARTAARKVALLIVRAFCILVILWCVLQPAIRLSQVEKMQNTLAVLIDTSASMSIATSDKNKTRLDDEAGFIEKNRDFFERLEKNYAVHYYSFNQNLAALSGRSDIAGLKPEGQGTEILESLGDLLKENATQTLAGVLLLSDGGDNGKLQKVMQALAKNEKADAEVKESKNILDGFPARVNAVVCGGSQNFKDLAIIDVVHDEYAFVHNPFEVVVKLRADGNLSGQIPLTFKKDEEVIATRQVDVSAGGVIEVKLDFTPRQVGEFFFTVEVPVYEGEASDKNNSVRFPLRVLRDKVRVLYIVGNPSWDERFLRLTMKKNPSVDLVSFYILREPWDNTEAPQNEVSLIPFPVNELFTKELQNFDLIIFQNFFGNEYMPGDYMRLLHDYVTKRGGSYLVIGGIRGLLGANPFNAMLEDILPVDLVPQIPNWQEGEYKMNVTAEGRSHPIMKIADNPEDNDREWESIPALDGINTTLRAKPAALVLGVHPFLKGAEGPLPVISVMESGPGRTMVVATDSTWRWSMMNLGLGKTPREYQRFWDNALRWLLKDPEMKQLSLTRDRSRVAPGDKVRLMLEVLDESYKPTNDAEVKVEVSNKPEGSALTVPELSPAGKGKYSFELIPDKAGAYRVQAGATLRGRSLSPDEVIFEVAEGTREFEDLAVRPDYLMQIAKATGGSAIKSDQDPDDLKFPNPSVEKITGVKDLPLWDNPIVYFLGLASLGLLWYLRRRWGMS